MSSAQAAQGRQIDAQPLVGAVSSVRTEKSAEDSRYALTPERMPADWWPCEQQLEQARERYTLIDVNAETQKFVEVMSKSRKRRKSWLSTWRGTLIAEQREQVRQENYARRRAEQQTVESVPVPDPERAAAEAAANGGRPRLRVVRDA